MKHNSIRQMWQALRVFMLLFACCVSSIAWGQGTNSVKGHITDGNGEPLIGVSILVKNTNNGTVSDLDGNFTLSVNPGDILRVTYVGYASQEIPAVSGKIMRIVLKEDTELLDEVVVVGYGTQKKVNLTGAVSSITSEDLMNKPVMSTAQAIAGLAPGLSVVANSGRPGAGANVKIRGTGTFSSAGTDPLVLIDGLSGSLDDVDPNDIQSISFLKDAASASIYGNRAANGVILIETKKGAQGKTTITYNASFGWQNETELPEYLPSWEYCKYYNMAMTNMDKQEVYTPEQIQKYKDGTDPDNYPNVDHLKWILNTGSGFQHQHNVSVQGGNERINYNLSIGYRKQDGLTAKTSNERMTALFTMRSQLTNNLSLDLNINAYNNKYKAPNGEPASIDGIIGFSARIASIIPGKKSDGTYGYMDNYSPEAWMNSESFVENISRNISASGLLNWKTPLDGLSLLGKAGVNYWTRYDKSYRSKTSFDENKTVGPATLNIWTSNNTTTILEALANYDQTFNKHDLKVLLGISVEQTANRGLEGYRNTFPNNTLYQLGAGDASTATNNSSLEEYALLSFFGRINYAYNDRYLLEANIRYDGSSRFAKDNRWGVFPSASVGWRLSEESFWKDHRISEVVNNVKLRASYGVLGNQNIGVYPYQQTYDLGHSYPFGNPAKLIPGTYISTYKNPDITWEKTAIANLGLDFGLLNNTLSGTIEYFYKYTSDILAPVEITGIMGQNVGESNVGAVSNQGIEVNLSYNGHIGKNFRFSIAPNFTWVKNMVEELSNGATQEINNNRIVGEPIGIIYGYETEGLFVDETEIAAAPEQLVSKTALKPGYIRYKDISGPNGVPDGKVDSEYDRTVLGSTTPKFYYGLNLSASFKSFDFVALFQGLGGYERLMGAYQAYAFYNGGSIQRWQAENCWTKENPDKWAKYPRIETIGMSDTNIQTSDYWLRNASFLRLKNLQLGYTFPQIWTQKIGIDRLRVYISGQNLLTFNKFYKGFDPENEIATGDQPSYYPITAIYSFGFNLKF